MYYVKLHDYMHSFGDKCIFVKTSMYVPMYVNDNNAMWQNMVRLLYLTQCTCEMHGSESMYTHILAIFWLCSYRVQCKYVVVYFFHIEVLKMKDIIQAPRVLPSYS